MKWQEHITAEIIWWWKLWKCIRVTKFNFQITLLIYKSYTTAKIVLKRTGCRNGFLTHTTLHGPCDQKNKHAPFTNIISPYTHSVKIMQSRKKKLYFVRVVKNSDTSVTYTYSMKWTSHLNAKVTFISQYEYVIFNYFVLNFTSL